MQIKYLHPNIYRLYAWARTQEQALIAWLDGRVCQNVHEVRAYIWDNLQIHYSKLGCIKLLHGLGFEYTKPQRNRQLLPGHIDEAAQIEEGGIYCKLSATLERFNT